LTFCPLCGRINHGKNWLKPAVSTVRTVMLSGLKKKKNLRGYNIAISSSDINLSELLTAEETILSISISKKGIKIQEIDLIVVPQKHICPLCMRKRMGLYFEYVIHVRFSKGRLRDNIARVQKIINNVMQRAFANEFVDVKKVPNGLDIRVSDKRLGRILVRHLSMRLPAEFREYVDKRFDRALNKQIIVHKVMMEA